MSAEADLLQFFEIENIASVEDGRRLGHSGENALVIEGFEFVPFGNDRHGMCTLRGFIRAAGNRESCVAFVRT